LIPMNPCAVENGQRAGLVRRVRARVSAHSDEESDGDKQEGVGQERVDAEQENDSNVVATAVG